MFDCNRMMFNSGEPIQLIPDSSIRLFPRGRRYFVEHSNDVGCAADATVASSNKEHHHAFVWLPTSEQVVGELGCRVLGGKCLNTLAMAITKSLAEIYNTSDLAAKVDRSCGRIYMPGILLEAKSGNGKTCLLNALFSIYGESNCAALLRCHTLRRSTEGGLENDILEFFRNCMQSGRRLILVDDVDLLVGTKKDTPLCAAVKSCLDQLLDPITNLPRAFVLFTCTDANALNEKVFTEHWRSKRKLVLQSPTEDQRICFFKKALSAKNILIPVPDETETAHDKDSAASNTVEESPLITSDRREQGAKEARISWLANELAVRTQSCSVSDLVKLLRDHVHKQLYNHLTEIPAPATATKVTTASQQHIQLQPQLDFFTEPTDTDIPRISVDAAALIEAAASVRPVTSLDQELQQLIVEGESSTKAAATSTSSSSAMAVQFIGLDDVKKRLKREVLLPFLDDSIAEKYREFGLRPCSGVLIEGPTGCGKTLLAHWLAEQGQRNFKFLSISCADLVHKVVGASEQRISKVFAAAREMAPCFLLLDNLEIILGSHDDDDLHDGDHEKKNSSKLTTTTVGADVKNSSKDYDYLRFQEDMNYKPAHRRRTKHQALDRMLSTLLVELDGIGSSFAATSITQQLTNSKPQRSLTSTTSTGGSAEAAGEASPESSFGRSRDAEETGKVVDDKDWDWDDIGGGASSLGAAAPAWKPVVVIATTANAALLDRAIKRPGRLEEFVRIPSPDLQQRCALLSHFVKTSMHKRTDVLTWIESYNTKYADWNNAIAQRLNNKSPADIKYLVQESLMELLRVKCIQTMNGGGIQSDSKPAAAVATVSGDMKVDGTAPAEGEDNDTTAPSDLVDLYEIIWKKCPVNYFDNKMYTFQ